MSVQEENGYRLWLECRRQENYYRFLGDVLLALNKQIQANMPNVRYAQREEPGLTIDPWPKPPCLPGQPCARTIEDLQLFVEQMAQRSVAVDNAVYATCELALDLHIKRVSFEPTQLPVYPEGARGAKPKLRRKAAGAAVRK
jgi:hypothetical protein